MRETFGTLLTTCKDYAVDAQTSSNYSGGFTDTESFFKKEINKAVRFIFNKYRGHKAQDLPKTMSTTADQIFYHYPPGLNAIKTITMSVGDVDYPLEIVESQEEWDQLQMVEYASSTVPHYAFPRRDSFGIYPTPQDSYTVTLTGTYIPKDMTAQDYIDGTISITQNSAEVTGSGTTFTAAMVGRWLSPADSDGNSNGSWYRIASYTDATTIALESVFEESSLSGDNYIIGESPSLPVEMHELIPYKVAATYFATRRRDPEQGQAMLNYFYSGDFSNPRRSGYSIGGGLLDIIRRYKTRGRNDSQIVTQNKVGYERFNEAWTTTLEGDNFGN